MYDAEERKKVCERVAASARRPRAVRMDGSAGSQSTGQAVRHKPGR